MPTPQQKQMIEEFLRGRGVLTTIGFEWFMDPHNLERERARFLEELLSEDSPLDALVEWIETNIKKVSKYTREMTSYGIKQIYERYTDIYVTNGTFIVAAYLAGFDVKNAELGTPNAFFNMSVRDLYRLHKVSYERQSERWAKRS